MRAGRRRARDIRFLPCCALARIERPYAERTLGSCARGALGAIIFALLAIAASVRTASASEFGISTYRPGLMDLYSGYLAPPGTLMVKNFFMFQDANERAITSDGRIEARSHTVSYTNAVFIAYVTKFSVLGSYWGVGVIPLFRLSEQSLRVGPRGVRGPRQTSTLAGPGDFIFGPCLLGWNFGQFHLSTSLMFYAPTGSYDRQRIIDIGLNRWAFEPDVGLTWLDERTGRHASLFVGYTVNTENSSTHYLSGQEFHADFVLAQHLPGDWVLGMAGYAFQQTTGDSGSGALFGPFRGRVLALGPLVGKTLRIAELPINFSLKYDVEFAAENRSTGNELWFNAAFRF
jgi:hypothetical protein